jgi:Fur family ferric uptake transcriptional regulator
LSAEKLNGLLGFNYDLSTIYRNLNFFTSENILKTMVFSDKVTYYYYGNGHFHYIYCVKCKSFSRFDMCFEEKLSEYIKQQLEFEIMDHTLYFEGICKDCKNRSQKNG